MPKRFTDTDKWKRLFIKNLKGPYKLLWLYILDECDYAGIWLVDFDVAALRIGEPELDKEKALAMFGDRVQVFADGEKWFVKDFIAFQYGALTMTNRVHKGVLEILKKNKLEVEIEIEKGLARGIDAPKEQEQAQEQVKVKVKEKDKDTAAAQNGEPGEKKDPGEQKKDQTLLLNREELTHRLTQTEYKTRLEMCSVFKLSNTEYDNAVSMFLLTGWKPDKNAADVMRHFGNWVKSNIHYIKSEAIKAGHAPPEAVGKRDYLNKRV